MLCTTSLWAFHADDVPEDSTGYTYGLTVNDGQLLDHLGSDVPEVLYYATCGHQNFFLQTDRLSLVRNELNRQDSSLTLERVDLLFNGLDEEVEIAEGEPMYSKHFYYAHCPGGITDVPVVQDVTYYGVFEGVDLEVAVGRGLDYTWTIAPGTSPSIVQWKVEGAKSISLGENGELILETSIGDLVLAAPVAYEMNGDQAHPVSVQWNISGNLVGYTLGNYATANVVIINPQPDPMPDYDGGLSQRWTTYFEGQALDEVTYDLAFDEDEDELFAVGKTGSIGFPAQNGEDLYFNGPTDAFAAKFKPDRGIDWATYIGGNNDERAYTLAVNSDEDVYVAGVTKSPDFPDCPGCNNPVTPVAPNGIAGSMFWIRLTNDGIIDPFSNSFITTFTSQSPGGIEPRSMAVGKNGRVYLGGYADPSGVGGLPYISATNKYSHPFSSFAQTFTEAGFILGVDGNNTLFWTTAIGQTGHGQELNALAVDFLGNLYVLGDTDGFGGTPQSSPVSDYTVFGGSFPLVDPGTPGAYVEDNQGGFDYFIMKFDVQQRLVWATQFGGLQREERLPVVFHNHRGITVDALQNVYITGQTQSTALFPLVAPSDPSAYYQSTFGGGAWDAFIAKFDDDYSQEWCTYLGGNGNEAGIGISTRNSTEIWVTGGVSGGSASSFPTQQASGVYNPVYYQPNLAGPSDGFVARITPNGIMDYASLFGGAGSDYSYAVATSLLDDQMAIGGGGGSSDFPFKDIPGAADYYYDVHANGDAFVGNIVDLFCYYCQRKRAPEVDVSPAFTVSPNPAHDLLLLHNPRGMYLDQVSWHDLTGRQVQTQVLATDSAKVKLDISGLSPGIYWLRIGDQGLKVMVE